MTPPSIYQMLKSQARSTPHQAAIIAPHRLGYGQDRPEIKNLSLYQHHSWPARHPANLLGANKLGANRRPLTYLRLWQHVQDTINQLNQLGIGRHDKVAIVLPNGPEMAVAFLSITAAAICAPLNPACRRSEYDFYLSNLEAKALVILAGMESPVLAVAQARNIPIITLSPRINEEAGLFTLSGSQRPITSSIGPAQADDVALVLYTLDPPDRAKLMSLTQRNLNIAAINIQQILQLMPQDRCLNIMPLFHIHGLVGAMLSSISAGAGVVCMPSFYPPHFFDWLHNYQPTWYTATPTVHQAILAEADKHQEVISQTRLRFIHSASSLSPQMRQQLEDVFKAPVIDAYSNKLHIQF